MFLRKTSRFKDEKIHDYWSVAENARAGRCGMFEFLRDRWAGLFASNCRIILYDLTSTYFEVDGT